MNSSRRLVLISGSFIALAACTKVPASQAGSDPDKAVAQITVTSNQSGTPEVSIKDRQSSLFVLWNGGARGNLFVDNETGCEYIVVVSGGPSDGTVNQVMPRLGKDGKPICRDDNIDPEWLKAHNSSDKNSKTGH